MFDGTPPEIKSGQEKQRAAAKVNAKQKAVLELEKGNRKRASDLFKQCISISHNDVVSARKQCRKAGVDCIVAPLESDAQLTYLCDILMCILSGCDYLPSVKK